MITLIDLAQYIQNTGENLKIESFILEESHIIPRIKPRFYSLANNPAQNGYKTVKFVFSNEIFESNGVKKEGFCTSFLSNQANIGKKIKCNLSILYRVLRLPDDNSAPLIFIAQGTGIAPFVSMLEAISADREITVLYGVRDNSESMVCKKQILEIQSKMPNLKLFLACSRNIDQNTETILTYKGYIQKMIQETPDIQEIFRNMKNHNSSEIMLCGGRKAINEILNTLKAVSGEEYIEKMSKNDKIKMEIWGE